MPRWSTRDLVLAGSIAANLVLLGFVVGAGVRFAGPGAPNPPAVEFDGASPRALMFALEPEQRAKIREEMVGEGLRSASLFRELRDARRDLEAAVVAEPFDAAAARAALQRQREIGAELQERGDDLIVRIVSELTPEQRAQAIDTMRQQAQRFRERGERRSRDRGDGPDGPPGEAPPRR